MARLADRRRGDVHPLAIRPHTDGGDSYRHLADRAVTPGGLNPVSRQRILLQTMTAVRRRLSTIAAFWLLLQLAGIVVPSTLSAFGFAAAEALCNCPDVEPGALCPMHHTPSSRSHSTSTSKPADAERCRIQNARAPIDAALLSLAGGTGILATVAGHKPPMPPAATVIAETVDRLSRAYSPDSPPPRV
jgi:hypothetical protein